MKTRSILKTFVSAVIVSVALSACTNSGHAPLSLASDDDLSDSQKLLGPWELVFLTNADGEEIILTENDLHVIRFFSSNIVSGTTVCNEYGANYETNSEGLLKFQKVAATEIACPQPNRTQLFLNGLISSKSFNIDDGMLEIFFGENGRMVFLSRLD